MSGGHDADRDHAINRQAIAYRLEPGGHVTRFTHHADTIPRLPALCRGGRSEQASYDNKYQRIEPLLRRRSVSVVLPGRYLPSGHSHVSLKHAAMGKEVTHTGRATQDQDQISTRRIGHTLHGQKAR